MKKFLLSTSAIVGVGLIAAPAGAAERIKLGLGGYMEQYIGFVDAENDTNVRDIGSFDVKSDSEVYFSGSTKLDNGITVGVRVELEGEEGTQGDQIDESWLDIGSPTLGNLRIGSDDQAAARAIVQPDRGISADYDNWIVEANMTKNDNAYDSGGSGDDTKITYFSPRIVGFQLGATYVPEPGNNGGDTPNYITDAHSAYAVSLTWKGEVAGVGINSQVGTYKEGTQTGSNMGETNYNVGLRLSYQGFDLGGAYGRFMDDQSSGTVTTSDDGYMYSLGLSYKTGPYKVGVWHLYNKNEGLINTAGDDKMRATTLWGEYTLSDGVKLQAMVFNVNYDEETNVDANEQSGGFGVVAGMRLDF